MLKTQKLFKELGSNNAIAFLKDTYSIEVKEYPNFCVLNYNQIFSPEDNDYVMECRSLQLDYDGNVVSRAYPRFFNYGQRPDITGKFVFENASILEKADGSLIKIYWNPFDHVYDFATRGTAYAESESPFYSTYRRAILEDGFEMDWDDFEPMAHRVFDKTKTYVFEYCSLKNRIVTPYEKTQMVLVAVFDNATGEEESRLSNSLVVDQINNDNVRLIKQYYYKTEGELLKGLKNLKNLEEGFVAQDVNGLRVKFKNDLYVKLHKLRGNTGFTESRILDIIIDKEEDEVLCYFPEMQYIFNLYINARNELFYKICNTFEKYKHIESQKEYAMIVKDLPYSGYLFSMKQGKSFEEAWLKSTANAKSAAILKVMNK